MKKHDLYTMIFQFVGVVTFIFLFAVIPTGFASYSLLYNIQYFLNTKGVLFFAGVSIVSIIVSLYVQRKLYLRRQKNGDE